MTIKDIRNDEELLNSFVEDIDDFEEKTEVFYEVWAFGYDPKDEITDAALCMFSSADPEEAVNFAKSVELADVIELMPEEPCGNYDIVKITVEVESTIQVNEEEFMNAGTLYTKVVWEADDLEDDEVIIALLPSDYTLFEDNSIQVKREALKGFNKNDRVMVTFPDDPDQFPIVYRIMSTVICDDGDYYRCELDI